jgi:hypothetical protein
MLDLTPATGMLTKVVTDIGDDQLGGPTPCRDTTVADLLDHVDGLCLAFTAAAVKDGVAGSQAPAADGSRLDRTGGCAYPTGWPSWPPPGRTRRRGPA